MKLAQLALGAQQLFVDLEGKSILPIARVLAVLGTLLAFAWVSKADSIVNPLGGLETQIVGAEILAGSVLPIAHNYDIQLARNVLQAQAAPSCWYCGPQSLADSIQSVDRTIDVAYCCWLGSPDAVTPALTPLVWLQSTIAINPNATVSITPSSINFGEVPVSTPEPSVWTLCLAALAAFSWLPIRRQGIRTVQFLKP